MQVQDPLTGTLSRVIVKKDKPAIGLLVAPDGRWLATVHGGRVRTWDPVTGDRLTNKGGARPVRGLAVSTNGRTLAVALGDRVIEFRDPDTGAVKRRVSGSAGDRYTAIAPTYWDRMFVAATGNVLQAIPGYRSARTCEGTPNY